VSSLLLAGGYTAWVSDLYRSTPSLAGRQAFSSDAAAALVVLDDRVVPYLSQKLDSFYPQDIAVKLLRKDLMPGLLRSHGFPYLVTVRANSNDALHMTNFIVKPLLGAGCSSWISGSPVAYKKFVDYKELIDYLRGDASVLNSFMLQEAVLDDRHVTASVAGTVNAAGKIMFIRPTLSYWSGGVRRKSIRSFSHAKLRSSMALLTNFIKAVDIRCAAFSLQLIEKDGVFFPIDWNFHLPATYVIDAVKTNADEFYSAVHHMMGHTERVTLPSDSWIVSRAEATNGLDCRAYSSNRLVVE
jgi:hypothetical protein